jgi:hypothetical protein
MVTGPTKEGLWGHKGKGEDIIVFKGRERFIPIVVEGHIAIYPDIKTALTFVSTGREEAVLLVELISSNPLHSNIEKLK